MACPTLRPISWIKAARKDFEAFPAKAIDRALDALTVVADGGVPDMAKPLAGLGAGVWDWRSRHTTIDLVRERIKRLKEMLA